MNKLIKLSETHYIIIDDSQIKKDDWCLLDNNVGMSTGYQILKCLEARPKHGEYDFQDNSGLFYTGRCKKITHSTRPESIGTGWMQTVSPLLLSEVEEVIREYSTYELFKKVDGSCDKGEYEHWLFEQGFKAHQELVKDKLFTLEDIRRAILQGRVREGKVTPKYTIEEIIQSLLPKTEWEIIFNEGKIKLL
jgi:hypothetical protein